jgi:hypothetical protein
MGAKNSWIVALTGVMCFSAVNVTQAAITGPYTPDANTVYLFHFDESAGATSTPNAGTAGNAAYAWNGSQTTPATPTTLLGAAAFTGFGNAGDLSINPNTFGYDGNSNGMFEPEPVSTPASPSPDGINSTSMVSGAGSFTVEAMVQFAPGTISTTYREFIGTDSSISGSRGFSFRITTSGNFQFRDNDNAGENTRVYAAVPTTGDHAYDTTSWFHVAYVYDANDVGGPGTGTGRLYWTKVADSLTTANLLSEQTLSTDSQLPIIPINFANAPLILGGEGRGGNLGSLQGLLDEVRISNVARGPGDFIFGTDLQLPGDFNADGIVDAADYVIWRKSGGPPEDYDEWHTHFGQTASGGGSSLPSAAVPEPSTWLLLAGLLMIAWTTNPFAMNSRSLLLRRANGT